ncbi:hypothetical protein BFP70_07855 [Thioclava sp. SK-1]|uniref:isochorismatase family protein n=1 Tax=Thioclava sp. SK-1 TaxID=1889770 RepID=UPI000826C5A8|nr:isochorismatase family protein [Thioclava sp. SK-1]OCX66025.1 hypothetical protein BFP70_07855 [Thioclava sp. SK-1]
MNKALLILDMQAEMLTRIDAGRDHVNGNANTRISLLAKACRDGNVSVIHIRHRDMKPGAIFHPNAKGAKPLPCDLARGDEMVFQKSGSSAFSGTDLQNHLMHARISDLIICGAETGFGVASTARAACDLGYGVTIVEDAVLGFDLPDSGVSAQQIHDVTIGLLRSGFADISTTAALINEFSPR